MYLRVNISTENEAFDSDEKCGTELARILRDLAGRVENKNRRAIGRSDMPILDVNGNRCGYFTVTETEEQFIVATGDAFDGLKLIGPFIDRESADDYAASVADEWHVVPLVGED